MDVFNFHLLPWTGIQDEANAVWPFDEAAYDREMAADSYEEYLSLLARSEDLGFDGVALNEHHFSTYAMNPSPNVIASNLAARTTEIDIAFMGNVIPIRDHPIRVAEELAVLDNLTRGRILSGFARGIPIEYLAYGVDRDESRARFREAWELIVRAWTADEPFDWDGEYWQYENVYIWPKPYQEPHPPLLMPAGSEESLAFAAEKGVPIGQSGGASDASEVFDQFRAIASEEHGWSPTDEDFVLAKGIYVADSREEAIADIREHSAYRWNVLYGGVHRGVATSIADDDAYVREKHRELMPPLGREAVDFDLDTYLEDGRIIAGDPDHVLEELRDQYETVDGFGRLFGEFQFGTLPAEKADASMRRFAEHVLPELRGL